MIRADYHTHTTRCDGRNTPAEMAEAAAALGLRTLGFSGHMDPDISLDFPAYLAEIGRLAQLYEGRMEILCGVELDQRRDPADARGAEYIIGSTHYLDGPEGLTGVDNGFERVERLCREAYGGDWYRLCAAYFAEEAEVVSRTGCAIVGHFDLIARYNHEHPRFDEADPRYLGPALAAMERLVRQGAVFEINCGAFNRGRRRDFYPAEPLLRALKDFGGEIVITSDAHDAAHLAAGFAEAEKKAAACGFREALLPGRDARGRFDLRHGRALLQA